MDVMELTWITHPPSRGGFYWTRLPETARPQIVWVYKVELAGKPPLLLVFRAGTDEAYPPNRVVAWAGPIPEPEVMKAAALEGTSASTGRSG